MTHATDFTNSHLSTKQFFENVEIHLDTWVRPAFLANQHIVCSQLIVRTGAAGLNIELSKQHAQALIASLQHHITNIERHEASLAVTEAA